MELASITFYNFLENKVKKEKGKVIVLQDIIIMPVSDLSVSEFILNVSVKHSKINNNNISFSVTPNEEVKAINGVIWNLRHAQVFKVPDDGVLFFQINASEKYKDEKLKMTILYKTF